MERAQLPMFIVQCQREIKYLCELLILVHPRTRISSTLLKIPLNIHTGPARTRADVAYKDLGAHHVRGEFAALVL